MIKIGCDPEIALRNPNSGKFVSAEGIVPGSKKEPVKVKKGTVQVDGFAAEIGIDPASNANEFADNVETVLEELKRYTGAYEFVYTDALRFDKDVFLAQSDAGRQLGCDPDFSAHTKAENPMPVPNPLELRTFSGHIHIGWDEGMDITDPAHFLDCINVAKQMDWSVGVPSTAWNKGTKRRSLYGKAGCFRPKPYGMEYRTPDNGWLVSRERMEYVANGVLIGMEQLYKANHYTNRYGAKGYIDSADRYAFTQCLPYIAALGIPAPVVSDEVRNYDDILMVVQKPQPLKKAAIW